MIAVHLLTEEEVAGRLNDHGCVKTSEHLDEASLWVTPWNFHFWVPEIGPDKMCAEYVLSRIIDEMLSTKPQNH